METLVIGQDNFALVEAVKRLNSGAMMAIAIDRPVGTTAYWLSGSAVRSVPGRGGGTGSLPGALVGVTFVRQND
jgi:hypothetical protein